MIIVRLTGGLGNQLFQYAAGRRLARIRDTVLKIDSSLYKTYTLHAYSIWRFNILENIASADELATWTVRRRGIVERAVRRLLRRPPKPVATHIREKHFHFDPDILNRPDGVYLDGYWQSEKYFADIAGIVRREFTVKTPPAGKDKELAEWMAAGESVSLHIRRGCTLLPPYNAIVENCSLDYYFKCVKYLARAVKRPHFFIFSDDPQWAQDNLKLSYPTTYVDHNGADKDYEDLRLMSLCKHHVMANSTFSWWGAWLNANPEKVVVAPAKWFKDPKLNPKDLLPEAWVKI